MKDLAKDPPLFQQFLHLLFSLVPLQRTLRPSEHAWLCLSDCLEIYFQKKYHKAPQAGYVV